MVRKEKGLRKNPPLPTCVFLDSITSEAPHCAFGCGSAGDYVLGGDFDAELAMMDLFV